MSAATAEAVAIQKGLDLVERLGCKRIIVESDSLEVIQACGGLIEIWDGPYTAIVADILQKSFSIGLVSFAYCNREANKVAHNLARVTFMSKTAIFWDGDPPSGVINDIIDDDAILRVFNKNAPEGFPLPPKKSDVCPCKLGGPFVFVPIGHSTAVLLHALLPLPSAWWNAAQHLYARHSTLFPRTRPVPSLSLAHHETSSIARPVQPIRQVQSHCRGRWPFYYSAG